MPDRIEAGTLLCAVAGSGGKLTLKKVVPEHLTPILHKLEECGCTLDIRKDSIKLEAPKRLNNIEIKTMPYPGFPTDMQSIFAGMLGTAKGTSIIIENIFENRYKYVNELRKMGAKITVEGKICVIKGARKLYGAKVSATDLRGGASLIVAGVNGKGKTEINEAKYILRGYEDLDKKLNSLGAKIMLKKI
jgi:UDP-N-acetylglucosamine 1-carboxyvinyltransferase